MRAIVTAAVTLLACACAESEAELDARSPVRDRFPEEFAQAQQSEPPPRRPRSVSLGYIGDAPLGTEPTPPHHEPAWTRPFPCDWTNTCWAMPPPRALRYAAPRVYYVPYPSPSVGVYGEPPMEGE